MTSSTTSGLGYALAMGMVVILGITLARLPVPAAPLRAVAAMTARRAPTGSASGIEAMQGEAADPRRARKPRPWRV